MSNIEIPEVATAAIAKYRPTDAAIAKMRDEFMPLAVDGVDDKDGCAKVHEARMVVKGHRIAIEKTRVALKADALAFGRAVDGEAKRLTGMLTPIEAHLTEQEEIVTKEAERRRQAEEARKAEALRTRMVALADVRSPLIQADVAAMSDEEFDAALIAATASHKDALAAERAAAEERRLESERIAAERAEFERQRAEQAERQAEIDRAQAAERAAQEAERRKLDEERAAIEREKAEAQRKADIAAAEERARKQAIADAKAEEQRVIAEEAARLAAQPLIEKLAALGGKVAALQAEVPDFPGAKAARDVLARAAEDIRTLAPFT